jgi:DHA1 family multidrug/chloramphenicol efflux transport protein-like MFS transporter
MEQFLVARFFQGTGLCFISVIGYATLQEIFAEMDAIRLIALMANVSTLAPLVGPLLGAVFIHYFSWRIIFVMIGTLALLALWGLWRFMPEPIGQIKRDGEQIKQIPFLPVVVAQNYKKLLITPAVIIGSLALGLLSMPCIVWIALAPVILIDDAKLSVIQYGLWQLPLFGSSILGNWVLQKLTHRGSIKKLVFLGSVIASVSLLFSFLLSFLMRGYFIWLMPGLIVYFFGLGIATAPLTRLILFCTPVAKGTTSALMSIVTMVILAIGIEIINILYASHNNTIFGFYCAVVGIIYFLLMSVVLWFTKTPLK